MTYQRISATGLVISAYRVFNGKKKIGYVWKRRGFSYLGMQGWNRGIRIRDFHPIEWRCSTDIDATEVGKGGTFSSRFLAAKYLLEVKS